MPAQRELWILLFGDAVSAGGCSKVVAEPVVKPPVFEAPGQAKRSVAASQDKTLVVEWPSGDRAQLGARAKTRVVVIRYDGCEPRRAIRIEGKLAWAGELTIDMMMVGWLDIDTPLVTANEFQSVCAVSVNPSQ